MGIIISGSTAVDNNTLRINEDGQIEVFRDNLPPTNMYKIKELIAEEETNNEAISFEGFEGDKKYLMIITSNAYWSSSRIRTNEIDTSHYRRWNLDASNTSANFAGQITTRNGSSGLLFFSADSDQSVTATRGLYLQWLSNTGGDERSFMSSRYSLAINLPYSIDFYTNNTFKFKVYELE